MPATIDELPPLSVVVCTRNRAASLDRLLHSMRFTRLAEGAEWDVLVVDNGSADDTADVLARHRETLPLRVLQAATPGLSHARNAALAELAGRHSVWTDDDVTVTPEWLSVYERAFRFWPERDFFGAPVLARFEGEPPAFVEAVLEQAPEVFAQIDPEVGFADLGADADILPFGANMAFRAGVLDDLRFDPSLGRRDGALTIGGEESALFANLVAGGARGLWLPPARVRHWLDPARQTPRYLYDFLLGEALVEELRDAGALDPAILARVDEEMLGQGFRAACDLLPVDLDGDGRAWLAPLCAAAATDGRALACALLPPSRPHFRAAPPPRRRLLAIGLDGFERRVAEPLVRDGRMPCLAALLGTSARFDLDQGEALYSGLGWEQFATGCAPPDYGRYSAVDFDPQRYLARQRDTRHAPFVAGIDAHTLVFDVPYLDLRRVEHGSGLVNFGAHDPGVSCHARPASLVTEVRRRFGAYPAKRWIYGFSWPSAAATRAAGEALVEAVEQRARIGRWLLTERFDNWQLALFTVAELHSAIEPFWHGVDAGHPLHHAESAAAAREALEAVYRAVDRLLAQWTDLPGVELAVFSMHGMGGNHADLPSMLFLPELLYRRRFGEAAFQVPSSWSDTAGRPVMLAADADWSSRLLACIEPRHGGVPSPLETSGALAWMPASAYRGAWPEMDAFALPSFYDGRVRVNLAGREARGRVEPASYQACLDAVVADVEAARDWRSGEPVVASVSRHRGDPMALAPSDADLCIRWRGYADGWQHPRFGHVGPAPFRRTGGHQGPGLALLRDMGLPVGDHGMASAFDVAPTLLRRLHQAPPTPFSGAVLGAPGEQDG